MSLTGRRRPTTMGRIEQRGATRRHKDADSRMSRSTRAKFDPSWTRPPLRIWLCVGKRSSRRSARIRGLAAGSIVVGRQAPTKIYAHRIQQPGRVFELTEEYGVVIEINNSNFDAIKVEWANAKTEWVSVREVEWVDSRE